VSFDRKTFGRLTIGPTTVLLTELWPRRFVDNLLVDKLLVDESLLYWSTIYWSTSLFSIGRQIIGRRVSSLFVDESLFHSQHNVCRSSGFRPKEVEPTFFWLIFYSIFNSIFNRDSFSAVFVALDQNKRLMEQNTLNIAVDYR